MNFKLEYFTNILIEFFFHKTNLNKASRIDLIKSLKPQQLSNKYLKRQILTIW